MLIKSAQTYCPTMKGQNFRGLLILFVFTDQLKSISQFRCWVYVDMFAGSRDPCRWVSAKYAVVKYRSASFV